MSQTKPTANQIKARQSMIKALKLAVSGNTESAKKELKKADKLLTVKKSK